MRPAPRAQKGPALRQAPFTLKLKLMKITNYTLCLFLLAPTTYSTGRTKPISALIMVEALTPEEINAKMSLMMAITIITTPRIKQVCAFSGLSQFFTPRIPAIKSMTDWIRAACRYHSCIRTLQHSTSASQSSAADECQQRNDDRNCSKDDKKNSDYFQDRFPFCFLHCHSPLCINFE